MTRIPKPRQFEDVILQRRLINAFPYFSDEEDFVQSVWIPVVDISERKERITVRAELPGIRKEDLDVSIEDDILTIAGEKNPDDAEENIDDCLRSERFYGAFCRSFSLPAAVDVQRVKAVFRDGVLELQLPKNEGTDTGHQRISIY